MRTKTYKLYGTTAASANALATVIIQRSGYIHAIVGNLLLHSSTTGHGARAELSKLSVSQYNTNDTTDVLCELDTLVTNAANGTVNNSKNVAISGLGIPVTAGDRLYLNVYTDASMHANWFIYVAE